MFMVMQHPFADLRGFAADGCGRIERPAWPVVMPRVDFVRSSGSVRPRLRGGVAEWEGEESYCDAASAMRFPDGMSYLRLGTASLPLRCQYSFRRYYSQGTAARIEVGLRLAPDGEAASGSNGQWLQSLFSWLSLDVSIGSRGHRGQGTRLIDAGPELARHYLRASTKRTPPASAAVVPSWWFQAGMPAWIVEARGSEQITLPPHTRTVAIPPALGRLDHAWLQIGKRRVSSWFLQRKDQDDPALRRLRIHLLRLHSERETLRAVLSAVLQHKLDIAADAKLSDSIQRYLNDAIRSIDRPARHGVDQTEMIDVARSAFEDLFVGDTATLATMRRQVAAKVEILIQRAQAQAATVNEYHYHGDYMNTTISLGTVTVTGDFNLTTAKHIENSFNKASSAGNPKLGDALKALSVQVAELAKQLPPEKREPVARDLETLTNEATSKAPRKAWYELSSQGLIDAAKAVAAMAGPVATAVGTVLGLLSM